MLISPINDDDDVMPLSEREVQIWRLRCQNQASKTRLDEHLIVSLMGRVGVIV